MSEDWRVDQAQRGEGNQIARLVRASLAPAVLPFTIWASPGVGGYVEEIIAGGFASESHVFYLLRAGQKAAGVAAFRWLHGEAFLNHLYIAPRFRGRSFGRRLLAESALRYFENHPAERVRLDLFAGARPAEAWYTRLGFRECGGRVWWLEPEPAGAARRAPTNGASRRSAPWGFSSFEVHTVKGRRYEVGCLYKPYFRITQPEAACDAELRQVLRIIDPHRRLLLMGPEKFHHPSWRRVAVTRRLEGDARKLLGRLLGTESRQSTVGPLQTTQGPCATSGAPVTF